MIIYLSVSFLALAASVFIFFEGVIISSVSVLPLALAFISVLQAVVFKSQAKEKNDYTSNTVYSKHEIDCEASRLSMKYHAITKLAIIPVLCVFALYFDNVWKIVFPVLIYVLSFFPVYFLVKYGKKHD